MKAHRTGAPPPPPGAGKKAQQSIVSGSVMTSSDSGQAAEENGLDIGGGIVISFSEIDVGFSRSGGPGGQHVNKTSTKAELRLDVANSPSIPLAEREYMLRRLGPALTSEGVLIVTSQENRSQLRNRASALEKMRQVLIDARKRPKPRRKTKPSRGAIEKRLSSKKKNSDKKRMRRGGGE